MRAARAGMLLAFLGACGEVRVTPSLLAVSTTSDNDAWAVGEAGAILHFDGHDWLQSAGDTSARLSAIWSIAPNDVWAVGAALTAVHWDGVSWSRIAVDVTDPSNIADFRGVWGAAANDVWAVADSGVFHWDGSMWFYVGVSGWLDAIYGTAANDIWAVGQSKGKGEKLDFHYDGSAWTQHSGNLCCELVAVWGSAPDHYWAGYGLNEWNGTTWSALDPGTHPGAMRIWGTDADNVWVLDPAATIWFWDGTSFSSVYTPLGPLHGIHGSGRDNVWAVGEAGLLVHWDGWTWTTFVQ